MASEKSSQQPLPGVLGLMSYVQQQGDIGRQQGKDSLFNRLAGQAYTAPVAQQGGLIGQMVGIDPKAGVDMGNTLADRNTAQQTDHMKKLGGAARYMAQALQTKNPQQIEGAYQAVRPYLAEVSGKQPPPNWDPAMEPALYQAIAQTGGSPEQKGVVLSAGGQLRNPMTGELLANNPQSLQYHDVPMGEGKAAGVFDPSTGGLRPAIGGVAQPGPQGAPQGDPMQPFIEQANNAIQMGAPEEKVRAWLMQQAQQIGVQPQAPADQSPQGQAQALQAPAAMPQAQQASAQFGVGTPKASADDSIVQKRTREIADLERNGVKLTDTQRQNYLTTGKPGEDSGATMQDPLAGLSPSDAALVKGISEYRVLPSSLGRSNNRAELLARASMINPDYNEAGAKGAYTYITDLSKSGTTSAGGTVQSVNTGLNHLGTLMRANSELSGTRFPLVNALSNEASTATGGTGATNWDQATNLFAQEMAKMVKGGVANEGEMRDIVSHLSASKSPAQRAQAIQQAAEFMYGRIQAVEDRGDRVLGGMAPDVSLMTKEAQDNLKAAYQLGGREVPELRPPGDTASYLKQLRHAGGAGKALGQQAPAGDFSHLWGG